MVSDYIEEYGSFLQLSDDELGAAKKTKPDIKQRARKIIEYGENRDGYWTSDKFMTNVKDAVDIAVQAKCDALQQKVPYVGSHLCLVYKY